MIVLTQITDTLQVVLGSSITTNQLSCVASWRDITSTPTYTPGRSLAATNSTTDVSLVASPAASTQRLIDYISIYNHDTENATVTVKIDDGGTEYVIAVQEIRPGQTLIYTSDSGFSVIGTPVESDWTYVTLTGDELNSTVTATNTALTFTPDASSKYEIEGRFYLQSAATTTGVRWGLVWPSGVDQNAAMGVSPNSSTAAAYRFWGNTAAANVAATGVAVINEGIYGGLQALMVTSATPSGSFTVTLASEIAASEVRIMQNSFIRYRKYV